VTRYGRFVGWKAEGFPIAMACGAARVGRRGGGMAGPAPTGVPT